jgi:hypothetical protein
MKKGSLDDLEEVESAFIDVLDGNEQWHTIQENTGLSEERCKEIESIYHTVFERYRIRHNIT